MKYLIFALSSLLFTAVMFAVSFSLLFCSDWTDGAWCLWTAQYVAAPLMRVVLLIPVPLFLLQLYMAKRIKRRSSDKSR